MINVPNYIGPSKLDLFLADAPELSDEKKEKVGVIQDINRLGLLLGGKPMGVAAFYDAYDNVPLHQLQVVQCDLQVAWNTIQYERRMQGVDFIQGHDF